ncbi:uncharacterized protein LOC136036510 isoform X1 [Artemia franciscana]
MSKSSLKDTVPGSSSELYSVSDSRPSSTSGKFRTPKWNCHDPSGKRGSLCCWISILAAVLLIAIVAGLLGYFLQGEQADQLKDQSSVEDDPSFSTLLRSNITDNSIQPADVKEMNQNRKINRPNNDNFDDWSDPWMKGNKSLDKDKEESQPEPVPEPPALPGLAVNSPVESKILPYELEPETNAESMPEQEAVPEPAPEPEPAPQPEPEPSPEPEPKLDNSEAFDKEDNKMMKDSDDDDEMEKFMLADLANRQRNEELKRKEPKVDVVVVSSSVSSSVSSKVVQVVKGNTTEVMMKEPEKKAEAEILKEPTSTSTSPEPISTTTTIKAVISENFPESPIASIEQDQAQPDASNTSSEMSTDDESDEFDDTDTGKDIESNNAVVLPDVFDAQNNNESDETQIPEQNLPAEERPLFVPVEANNSILGSNEVREDVTELEGRDEDSVEVEPVDPQELAALLASVGKQQATSQTSAVQDLRTAPPPSLEIASDEGSSEEAEEKEEVDSMFENCDSRPSSSMCSNVLPYVWTKLPNIAGDRTEAERNLSLPYFQMIIKSQCHPRAAQYACAVLEPPCVEGKAVPPCKKFCRAVADSCREMILPSLRLAQVFRCEQFPDSSDPEMCLNLATGGSTDSCASNEFQCNDGSCIPESWSCDGNRDCPNGEDEALGQCGAVPCSESEFKCESEEKCLPLSWRCDGAPDCTDGSDERGCKPEGVCAEGRFRCSDGKSCVPKRWVCDGTNHCLDNSDEINCRNWTCHTEDIKCRDTGVCMPKSWKCDGENDCADGSDEEECLRDVLEAADDPLVLNDDEDEDNVSTNTCPDGQLQCVLDSKCISFSQICDGKADCGDGADEQNCGSENF